MIDSDQWLSAVVDNRQSLAPQQTDVMAECNELPNIKAVIFDVYGTLIISGSGDVGSADESDHSDRILQSLEAVGLAADLGEHPTADRIRNEIRRMNQSRISDACPKPEVDIVEVWRRVLEGCGLQRDAHAVDKVVRLAAEYESRANPTYPMPGSDTLLSELIRCELRLGIVSNAQVFTPLLVEDLLPQKNLESGFDLDLCFFSNRFRQSKPGPRLFDALRESLDRRGILPQEAVYVGNDMLNDVWAASQAGLRTALFAGDQRSLRPRSDDPRCRSLRPDVVLTSPMQLLDCLQIR